MKHYKKTLLTTMMLATMPLLASTSSTPIKVTTFEDKDGENTNGCSLREALKVAEIRRSYGGCTVTDISSRTQKVIQLEAGTYTLKKELTPQVDVLIVGASPVDWQEKNVLINDVVNQYPAEVPLKTTIKAENSRIFNTTLGMQRLTLSNVILTGGYTSDQGGAIYAGADVALQSTQILDSQAKEGGAIFLAGPSASLTLSKSLIQGNRAEKGSILSMSCFNNLIYSKRSINFSSNSFINNGSQSSSSMFEFCGEPTAVFNTNTIAKNVVSTATGNLIKFAGDTKAGTDSNNNSSILSKTSGLTLTSNTIVENQAYTTLLYDKIGAKKLNLNVIAYNGDSNSYACRYLLGEVGDQTSFNIDATYNAFALKDDNTSLSINNRCDLPKEVFKDNKTNLNIKGVDFGTLLSYQPASANTAFLPLYYPKDSQTDINLVNSGGTGCTSTTDQRGLARIKQDSALYYNPNARNNCDIGSVQLMRFIAGDLPSLSNTSISGLPTSLINNYQTQYDFFDNLVKNPNDPDFLTYYKTRLEQYKNLLQYTKENLKYRAIYIDLKDQKLPLSEDIQKDGSYKLQFFSPDLYNVTTKVEGVGQISETVSNIRPDDNLVCKWVPSLQQIMVYRLDDAITSASEKEFCKYTITSIANPNISSSGLIQVSFTNIPPVAQNTSVTFKYQQKQKISLNLLDFANDDGDTGSGGTEPETNPDKPHFWKNADGIELPIRLSNVPTKDLSVTADRQGPCPEPDQKETCYGGNIYIQEVNAFNPFNFDFKYQVYDADGAISNAATVRTINTATTTDDTRKASNRGGGSTGLFTLFGLFGMLVYRRFKK